MARLGMVAAIAALILLAACSKKEEAPPAAAAPAVDPNAPEGQVDIVAWAGYIERGESDKAYDWVTKFEKETRLQGQREDRRHLRRDGVAHDPGWI